MGRSSKVGCACKLTSIAKQLNYIKCKEGALIGYSFNLMDLKTCFKASLATQPKLTGN